MRSGIICPICGSENPEGSTRCETCKANFENLPPEFFVRPDPPSENSTQPLQSPPPENEDYGVPQWIVDRLDQSSYKKNPELSFSQYLDAILNTGQSINIELSGTKSQSDPKSVRIPSGEWIPADISVDASYTEHPLVIPDKSEDILIEPADELSENFSVYRPERKWNDPAAPIQKEDEPAAPAFDSDTPAVMAEQAVPKGTEPEIDESDLPLIEADPDSADAVNVPENDSLAYCTTDSSRADSAIPPADIDTIIPIISSPKNGSLVSDFLMDIQAEPIAESSAEPGEDNDPQEKPEEKHPDADDDESLPTSEKTNVSAVNLLDQLLHKEGWFSKDFTERLKHPIKKEPDQKPEPEPLYNDFISLDETSAAPESEPDDAIRADEPIFETFPEPDETDIMDIPWNLFESGPSVLQSQPVDQRTHPFSENDIPPTEGSSEISRRMIASLISGVLHKENVYQSESEKSRRPANIAARCFWMFLILLSSIFCLRGDILKFAPKQAGAIPEDTVSFTSAVESLTDEVLICFDYTAGYEDELSPAAKVLLRKIPESCKVQVMTLNPVSIPVLHRLENELGKEFESILFLPGSAVAIQELLHNGGMPKNVILITADMISLRNWAEQLYDLKDPVRLLVLGSAQLSIPLLPYEESGMVYSAISSAESRAVFAVSEEDPELVMRERMGVWFICLVAVLAHISGKIISYFQKSPDIRKPKETQRESVSSIYDAGIDPAGQDQSAAPEVKS